MKQDEKKKVKVVKGTSSAVLLSIVIHAVLFLLAGMLVVFTVVKKEEKKFEPPKAVERPKMKLKKPKVKIKKSSKPKSTTRIVVQNKRASMPDMELPEMSGMGGGLGGGVGDGFDMMPDIEALPNPFGDKITTGSELEGYFYNFNRDFSGRKIPMSPTSQKDAIYAFLNSGWKTSTLSKFYRFPEPLYTPLICVPTVMSELAPEAFGLEAEGYCWGVLYKGKLVHPEDIRFRFWGVGDKLMAVGVDGETVLFCAYRRDDRSRFAPIWDSRDPKDNTYYFGEHRARPSDWIELKAGEARDIQVLMADLDGGLVYHMLSVEVEGEEYPYTRDGGGPTFPVFKTSLISRDMQDAIYHNLYPGDTCLTNGPIFNDFTLTGGIEPEPVENVVSNGVAGISTKDDAPAMRTWTRTDGSTFEAKFCSLMGQKAVLEDVRQKQRKFPLDQLSPKDREYIEFASPPRFDLNFSSKSKQIQNPPLSPWLSGTQRPLQIFSYTFGAKVKQSSSGVFNRKVTIEYFAIGEEVGGKNFVLLDRKKSTFTPTKENGRSHEFHGGGVTVKRMAYRSSAPMRGTQYGGNLITVTDERGKIIQYKTSKKFLYENLENLRKLKPNNHFNKECIRVIPARPTEDSRGPGAINGN